MGGGELIQIAKAEPGAGVGRADDFDHQCARRGDIVAKLFGACDFGQPVQSTRRGADCAGFSGYIPTRPHRHHRANDPPIPGATAQHPTQRILNLSCIRLRVFPQQGQRRHQHPRRANPALGGVVVLKAVGQALAQRIIRQPFGGFDPGILCLLRWHQTGTDRSPVHQHGAGPAIACIAADLDLGCAKSVA